MRDNNNEVLDAIKGHVDRIRKNMAQAIRDIDVPTLARYVGTGFIVLLIVIALAVGVLALVWKVLGTLLGKVLAVPLVLFVLGLSYKVNFEDSRKARQTERNGDALEQWAKQVYIYVRDSMYYVVQEMANGTNVLKPNAPYDIEMRNRFFRQGGHIVFQFYVQVLGALDKAKFREKLDKTITQMHSNGRLVGISSDTVRIGKRPYCPLQVLNVEAYEDGYTVQIVFADEETIPLVERSQEHQRNDPTETLSDDEL